MPSVITDAGRSFIAAEQLAGRAVDITTVKLAAPAFADPSAPPAPSPALTDVEAPLVHTAPVSGVGKIDPDNVAYSVYLDTTVGDFTVTQVGYFADDGAGGLVLVMVSNIPPVYKRANAAGQTGNNYKHTDILQIAGAAQAAGIIVPAATWQLDFRDALIRRPPYDVVVGSQAQVDAGEATHSIAQLSDVTVPAGARVLLLAGTHALAASLSLNNADVVIEGESAEAVLDIGAWGVTLAGARTQGRLRVTRTTGTVSVSGAGSRFVGIDLDIAAVIVADGASAETTGTNGGSKRTGSQVVISTTELAVEDNVVRLNTGETGAGVTLGSAGIEVARGSLTDAQLLWDEATDSWQAGTVGALKPLAPSESPAFAGTPTAPTPAAPDDGTRLATTAFVKALIGLAGYIAGLDAGGKLAQNVDATKLTSGILPAARFNDTAHGNRAGGALHALATAAVNGFMAAADKAKLDGIEVGATADQSAAEILAALLSVDGSASGLDADLVDGLHAASFLRADADDEATGRQVLRGGSHVFDAAGSRGAVEIRGPDNVSPALLALHRPGAFATYLGLDTDNQLKLGGWSLGAGKYKVWSENNDGAGSGLDADLLDGQQASAFAAASHGHAASEITSGSFPQARIAAGAVGQAQLKTALQQSSLSVSPGGGGVFTFTGGQYTLGWGMVNNVTSPNEAHVSAGFGGTYATQITGYSTAGIAITFLFQARYIQASPPYDLGDGEIPLFVFVWLDPSGAIRAVDVAPDPPWANNGPTCIRPDLWRDGKPFLRRRRVPSRPASARGLAEWAEACRCAAFEEIEVDQALKQADMPLLPHPFTGNDMEGGAVVLLDPVSPLAEQLLALHEAGESVVDLLTNDYLRLDNAELERACPPGVQACAAKWRNSR